MIQSLGDTPLRLAMNHRYDPSLMTQKLKERYESRNQTRRLALLTRLINVQHETGADMGAYVGTFAARYDRLSGNGGTLTEDMAVLLFLRSVNHAYPQILAATEAVSGSDLNRS